MRHDAFLFSDPKLSHYGTVMNLNGILWYCITVNLGNYHCVLKQLNIMVNIMFNTTMWWNISWFVSRYISPKYATTDQGLGRGHAYPRPPMICVYGDKEQFTSLAFHHRNWNIDIEDQGCRHKKYYKWTTLHLIGIFKNWIYFKINIM